MRYFLLSFQKINNRLLLLCVCPFIVKPHIQRLHTRIWHLLYALTVILVFETILWFVIYSELLAFDYAKYTMVELSLNVAAVSMACCFPVTAIFGILSRRKQIELLHSIVDLDEEFVNDQRIIEIRCRQSLRTFNRSFVIVVIFKCIAWLATIIVLGDTYTRCIFFACYSLSDGTFTIYINYVSFCGKTVATRFEMFIQRFQDFAQKDVFHHDIFMDYLRELNALYQLKERLYGAFGSIALFTIFYHSFTLAIAVYGIIITFDQAHSVWVSLITLLLYLIWMSTYLVRMIVLGHVYDVFGSQVCDSSCVCLCY